MRNTLTANEYSDKEAIKLVSIVAKSRITFSTKLEFRNWLRELKYSKFS